jgi:plastocyanin
MNPRANCTANFAQRGARKAFFDQVYRSATVRQLWQQEREKRMRKYSSPFLAALIGLVISALVPVPSGTAGAADASATLTGVVTFAGTAPKPSPIDMSPDPNCAKAHPTPATTEDIVVGAHGDLANVVVYISDGLGDHTYQPPQQAAVLEQKGCQYKPHVLALQANQNLEVVNSDETTHNIHPSPNINREWNMTQPHGVALEKSFAREEVAIPVKCNIHPWMRGYIAVFKHPYFAVTGQNGTFDLKDLPPGTYTVTAWQEKLGTLNQKVTVAAGDSKKLDFTFK